MVKYKQVLVLYNIKEREEVISHMIADILLSNGIAHEVIVGQVYEEIFHIYDYNPDLVISCLPRDNYSAAMFTMVKMVHGCAWVCIPPEGFVSLSPEVIRGFVGFNHQPKRLIDKALFWGGEVADAVAEQLLLYDKISSKQQVGFFGYLPYEESLICKYRQMTEQVKRIHEKSSGYGRVVMAVTARMATPVPLKEFEALYDPNDKEQNERVLKRHISNEYYAEKYIKLLETVAENNTDVLFLVKMHPRDVMYLRKNRVSSTRYEHLRTISNVCFIDEEIQISVYFDLIDTLIHYGSTTSLEAYIHGIPTIGIYNDHKDTQKNSLGCANFYADSRFAVSDIPGVLKAIQSKMVFGRNEETEKVLYRYMNYKVGEDYHPSRLLCEHLMSIDDPLILDPSDKEVRKSLYRPNVIKRRVLFCFKMIDYSIHGDKEEARRIHDWLRKYRLARKNKPILN